SLARMLVSITDDQGRIVEYRMDIHGQVKEALWNEVFNGGNLVSYCWTGYSEDYAGGSGYTHRWLKQIMNRFYYRQGMFGQWTSRVLTQNDYTYSTTGMRLTNLLT